MGQNEVYYYIVENGPSSVREMANDMCKSYETVNVYVIKLCKKRLLYRFKGTDSSGRLVYMYAINEDGVHNGS